jgi:hypothetical protein
MLVRCVEPTSGRVNTPVFVDDLEVQRATVGELKCQLDAQSVKASHDFRITKGGDATFDFQVGRDRFSCLVREVAENGKMIVKASNAPTLAEHISFADRLLYQTLHIFGTDDRKYDTTIG